jgi:predicted Zn-dependent protease
MTILNRDQAQALLKKVLAHSRAEGCQATLNGGSNGNIRYARNTVTTSGIVHDQTLAVASNFGKRSGVATINEFDDGALERVVRRSEELARLAPENPEFMEVLGPQQYAEGKGWFDSTAKIDAAYLAAAANGSIGPARERQVVAAGYLEHNAGFQAIANSKGLFAYYPSTTANFSVTMRSEDGTGSGWAGTDANDMATLDSAGLSRVALEKALRSREAKAIEPGKYTVVLEPAAVIDLIGFMLFGFDARQADEGRSFLAKPGGASKLGEKIVDERVTIYSDPTMPEAPVSPFAGDGRPRERTAWIEKGVVKNLFYSRYWAQKKGVKAVPFPGNGIMEGGTASVEDLVRDTPKGILVTRIWYLRFVDPQTVLLTGLTRDGTFYIENGKIAHPIKNMRFNESPVIMLNNIEALGKPVRVASGEGISSVLVPPVKARDFTFTSLSDAV